MPAAGLSYHSYCKDITQVFSSAYVIMYGCVCVCVCIWVCGSWCTFPQGACAVRPREHSKSNTHAHRSRSPEVPTNGDSPAGIRDYIKTNEYFTIESAIWLRYKRRDKWIKKRQTPPPPPKKKEAGIDRREAGLTSQ
jgi:hypothetical protein